MPPNWTWPNWFATSTSHDWYILVLLHWAQSCLNTRDKNGNNSRTLLFYDPWRSLSILESCQPNQKSTLTGLIYPPIWQDPGRITCSNWSTLPKNLIGLLATVNQLCLLDHPVYHHLPFPQHCGSVCMCPYVPRFSVYPQLTLYGLWVGLWFEPTLTPVAEL